MQHDADEQERAAACWTRGLSENVSAKRLNFWDSGLAMRLFRNQIEDADYLPGTVHLSELFLRQSYPRCIPFGRALSIGCGTGWREIDLMRNGVVQHFTLVEISEPLLQVARDQAKAHDLSDRVTTKCGDYRVLLRNIEPFDLVYWDNALHHMMDAEIAITTSKTLLSPGGVFFMNDYVGPTRNQFDDEALRIAERYRNMLPDYFFAGADPISRRLIKRSEAEWLKEDPSEAADSEQILPSLRTLLPGVVIKELGGLIYYVAMQGAYAKLDEANPDHVSLLRYIFEMDRVTTGARPDLTVYAVAGWQKPA